MGGLGPNAACPIPVPFEREGGGPNVGAKLGGALIEDGRADGPTADGHDPLAEGGRGSTREAAIDSSRERI